jgi:hypothetical protein
MALGNGEYDMRGGAVAALIWRERCVFSERNGSK